MQFLETNGKNAFKGILPFDRVVRPFGYYDKKIPQLSLIQKYQIEALVKAGMKQKTSYHPLNVNLASTLVFTKA